MKGSLRFPKEQFLADKNPISKKDNPNIYLTRKCIKSLLMGFYFIIIGISFLYPWLSLLFLWIHFYSLFVSLLSSFLIFYPIFLYLSFSSLFLSFFIIILLLDFIRSGKQTSDISYPFIYLGVRRIRMKRKSKFILSSSPLFLIP